MLDISITHDRKVLARLVSLTLKRPGWIPRFPRALELRYTADGRVGRIAHLKLSIALGLVIYNLFVFTDPVLIPRHRLVRLLGTDGVSDAGRGPSLFPSRQGVHDMPVA